MSVNKELDVIKYDIDNIKNLIYTIRGQQVMLDSDVAILFWIILLNREYILDIIETEGKAFARPWFGQLMTGLNFLSNLFISLSVGKNSTLLKEF